MVLVHLRYSVNKLNNVFNCYELLASILYQNFARCYLVVMVMLKGYTTPSYSVPAKCLLEKALG